MKQEELNETLRLHKLWIDGEASGKKANLQGANLQEANLQVADLQKAGHAPGNR